MKNDGEKKKPGLVELGLGYAADLDGLVHTLAFEQVMTDHMSDRTTLFQSQKAFDLDTSLLPKELNDIFYFPTHATISGLQGVLNETVITEAAESKDEKLNLWSFQLKFLVNGRVYLLTSNKEATTIQTDNSEGGTIDYKDFPSDMPSRLLGGFITSIIAPTKESQLQVLEDYIYTHDNVGYQKQLFALGHLIGTAQSRTTAQLPYEWGDRKITASYVEQESMESSGQSAYIDLGWELLDTSTELSLFSHYIKDKKGATQFQSMYSEISDTKLPIDEYASIKEMSELFQPEEWTPTVTIDRGNPRWRYLATIFMKSMGPLLDKYKYLDEISDDDGFDSPNSGAA